MICCQWVVSFLADQTTTVTHVVIKGMLLPVINGLIAWIQSVYLHERPVGSVGVPHSGAWVVCDSLWHVLVMPSYIIISDAAPCSRATSKSCITSTDKPSPPGTSLL